jgi:hypothetical protein
MRTDHKINSNRGGPTWLRQASSVIGNVFKLEIDDLGLLVLCRFKRGNADQVTTFIKTKLGQLTHGVAVSTYADRTGYVVKDEQVRSFPILAITLYALAGVSDVE